MNENNVNNINIINNSGTNQAPEKDWVVTLLLAIFLGFAGVHRFYTNKAGSGILYLFTGGIFGVGWLLDVIMILCKSYRDGYGRIVC